MGEGENRPMVTPAFVAVAVVAVVAVVLAARQKPAALMAMAGAATVRVVQGEEIPQ